MAQCSFSRPEGLRVTYRRMKFDFEDGFDRYWAGSPFRTNFWNQLSTAFQPGERFFIDAARSLKAAVEDPRLHEELAEFCKQEGHHTAQHLKFDRINEQMGVDVARCRARYSSLIDLARKVASPKRMLAITCALEHFTSSFADAYFSRPEISEGSDPKVQALWAWHAIEESEHRATCHDVYLAAGGGYWLRIGTLLSSWTHILGISLTNTLMLQHQDGKLLSRDTLRGLWFLLGPRGLVTSLVPPLLRYLAPGFHPWEHAVANAETVRRWQEQNARYIQNLADVEGHRSSTAA